MTTGHEGASQGAPSGTAEAAKQIAASPAETDREGSPGLGLRWGIVAKVATKMISFGMNLVLARVLAPEDFGLYAVALAANQILFYINDAGIVAATVQWRGKIEEMLPTATAMVLALSATVYGVFWWLAPFFAGLAGNPEAAPLVRLLTVSILIDGFVSVRSAVMLRRFQQDKIAKANMAGVAVQVALAIVLALNGAGAYSFAVGNVACSLVGGVLLFAWAGVPLRLALRRDIAVRLLRFGLPLAASLGVEAVVLNADAIIVGKTLGGATLGIYLLAVNVSNWVPGFIGEILRHVTLPGFARVAEHNPSAFSTRVRQIVPMLLVLVLPIAALVGALAPPLVVFLYGDKWLPAAGVLSFLMILMVVRMLTALSFDILTSLGATRSVVRMNLVWAAVLLPSLYAGAQLWGVHGVALAHAAVALLVALPLAVLLLSREGVVLRPLVPRVARLLLGGLAAVAAVWAVGRLTGGTIPFVQLCAGGAAGIAVFALVGVPVAQIREMHARIMT
ncbi:oligosaccharide flippase family protein [Microbispora bryophytorum]|uniref:oligosaccharide flippase family protein n=1 Tax=Microbispora bryophytorum TaxID=1460882 RepID=UPI0033CDE051